jgi:fatty-acyl-CoA synthase
LEAAFFMHPYQHARTRPEHAALVIADTNEKLTYGQLESLSNQAAQLFRSLGLKPGDRIGVLLKNSLEYAIVYWAAQRSGLLAAVLSTHLKPQEASYILNDSKAKVLITSADVGDTAAALIAQRDELIPDVETVFDTAAQPLGGAHSFHAALSEMPAKPIADQISGFYLVYSSGTTGRPKGVVLPFEPAPIEEPLPVEGGMKLFAGFDPLVAFNSGPLYHAAPLAGMIATQRLGGTYVTLRKFDAEQTLRAIQNWRIIHAQFVPTMFVRLLALPKELRASFDLLSLQYVVHAAAPCPVEIKRQMIEWLGPIVHEYYGASENLGGTYITSEEWLRKQGSVGRSQVGPLHICDEEGREQPPGRQGIIYFRDFAAKGVQLFERSGKDGQGASPEGAVLVYGGRHRLAR